MKDDVGGLGRGIQEGCSLECQSTVVANQVSQTLVSTVGVEVRGTMDAIAPFVDVSLT